jgi:hypothetical protein
MKSLNVNSKFQSKSVNTVFNFLILFVTNSSFLSFSLSKALPSLHPTNKAERVRPVKYTFSCFSPQNVAFLTTFRPTSPLSYLTLSFKGLKNVDLRYCHDLGWLWKEFKFVYRFFHHLQVVTTNKYNTIVTSALYSLLEHTLMSSVCYSVHCSFPGNGF